MKNSKINCVSVPMRREDAEWIADTNGGVTILSENKGFFIWLLGKPRISHIRLDEKGSFFWMSADGSKTLGEIAEGSARKFGSDYAESLSAAAKFAEILCGCSLLKLLNKC